MTKEVQNAVNYYFCDVCHYCFEAESLPDRCPDCGKVKFQERAAVRPATENEIQDLIRARAFCDSHRRQFYFRHKL